VVLDALLYGKDHPYGEVTTEASVESITIGMCEQYYKTFFRPNIAYLAMVGDVDLREAKKLAKKYFGNWMPAEVPGYRYPDPALPGGPEISLVDRPHAVQSVVKLAHPVKYTIGSPDYMNARVMNQILGGPFARFDRNLREEHAYTYGVTSSLIQDKWIGSFSVSTDVRNEVTDSAVYQILHEMKRIQSEPASSEEVEKIKNYLSGTFALSLEKPSTVALFALNTALYDLPADYYSNYLKYISEVTPGGVQAAARKYLKPDNCYILVVGKTDEFADKLSAFSYTEKVKYYDVEGNPIDPADLAMVIPEGLTAEKVIEQYLAAIGGRTMLETISDISVKMSLDFQGMALESELIRKAPDRFLMNMRMGENLISSTTYDGSTGKTSGTEGEKILEGKDLEDLRMQALFLPELDYGAAGYTLELVSVEKVDGRKAYKIVLEDPSGNKVYEYYDVESGYRVKDEKTEETSHGHIVQRTSYTDYRDAGGIMYPHEMVIRMGPQLIRATVTSIHINSGVEDSVFR
jgi:hypothetical protein